MLAFLAGFGAKIYESFIIKDKIKGADCIVQITIMKLYSGDVYNLLKNINGIDDIKTVWDRMISILNYMVTEFNMLCTDIKPENFVADYTLVNKVTINDIKMIDFGGDFCSYIEDHNGDNIYKLMLILLVFMTTINIIKDVKISKKELAEYFKGYFEEIYYNADYIDDFLLDDDVAVKSKLYRNVRHYGDMFVKEITSTSIKYTFLELIDFINKKFFDLPETKTNLSFGET